MKAGRTAKIRITDGVSDNATQQRRTHAHAETARALTWANPARLVRYHALIKFTGAYCVFRRRVLHVHTNTAAQHFIISVSRVPYACLSLPPSAFLRAAAHLSLECRSRVCRLTRARTLPPISFPPSSPPSSFAALLCFLSSRFRFVCSFRVPFVPFVIAFISLWWPVFFSSRCCSLFLSPSLVVLKLLSALRVAFACRSVGFSFSIAFVAVNRNNTCTT